MNQKSLYQSIELDYATLSLPVWKNRYKFLFLYTKYKVLINFIATKKFKIGESFCYIGNEKIFYNAPYGLATYQYIIKTHYLNFTHLALSDKPTILDIGANVGYFSKLARSQYPCASIYSFEPVPAIFLALQKNFEGDSKTFTINKAISNQNGVKYMNYKEIRNELSSINKNGNEKVQSQTLDSFISAQNIESIDLLKVDTEQHELQVLEGAINSLQRTKYLLIEVAIQENYNYTISSLFSNLVSDKFNFQLIRIRAVPNTDQIHYMDCLLINTLFSS
ncbi:MAG: FkbM family methyltransferase [bacterium]|nr:FkbM family methyltransferase [bacterium]